MLLRVADAAAAQKEVRCAACLSRSMTCVLVAPTGAVHVRCDILEYLCTRMLGMRVFYVFDQLSIKKNYGQKPTKPSA